MMSIKNKLYLIGAITVGLMMLIGSAGFVGIKVATGSIDTLDKIAEIDGSLNKGVIENLLRVEHNAAVYSGAPSEKNYNKLSASLVAAKSGIAEWISLVSGESDLSAAATQISSSVNSLDSKISSLQNEVSKRDKLHDTFDETVNELLAHLDKTMVDVVDPAKVYYGKRRDIASMSKWGDIDMVMNEGVIANALKLQTVFHDYSFNSEKVNKQHFDEQFKETLEGLDKWKETFKGEQLMVDAGDKSSEYFSKIHELFADLENTSLKIDDIENDINATNNQLEAVLDNVMKTVIDPKLEDVKSSAQANEKTSIAVMAGTFIFAIILLGVTVLRLIREMSGKLGVAVENLDYVARGNLESRNKVSSNISEINSLLNSIANMRRVLRGRSETLQLIADGDLTRQVEPIGVDDMFGNALRDMNSKLVSVVGQTIVSATQINTGTDQVADASGALSQGATEQASSIEEISSSMTELGSQTKQNAENASQANSLSASTRDSAEEGSSQMKNMVEAMDRIGESSKEIAKIIKVIDDIAFQTNLLALNAAVEAARAGKYGKGFAVVAEEVRTLAARSAKAAKETSELIEGSGAAVEEGVAISQQTAQSLEGIVNSARKTADLIGEIAAASNEQAQGISQINIGLDQIDKVTQQNTASAEETASAAEELSGQASELKRMMQWFKVDSSVTMVSSFDNGNSFNSNNSYSTRSSGNSSYDFKPAASLDAGDDIAQPPPLHSSSNAGDDGWGDAAVIDQNPEEIISLDDGDFGRY